MARARPSSIVILNPVSGAGAGHRLRDRIERALHARRIDFELHETEGPGHAAALAAAATAHAPDFVVAAGGDGTIHEVANGLLDAPAHDCALGVLPIGTGNDFVKAVPGLAPRARALDTLAGGSTRMLDVGHVSWKGRSEFFVNALGTGIDVEVVRQMQRQRHLPGGLVYLLALVRALARFEPIPITVRLDDETISSTVMMLAVGNGSCIGGAFSICPFASADDGLLDVCIVDEVRGPRIAAVLARVLRGSHARLSTVHMRRSRIVDIEVADEPFYFQLDGELREASGARRLHVEIRAAALRVSALATEDPVSAGRRAPAGRITTQGNA